MPQRQPAIFLDRDGVINLDTSYPHDPTQCIILDGVPQALHMLQKAGYLLILITNQSGIGRGYFPIEQTHLFHDHIQNTCKVQFHDIYICPHHPDDNCLCRKPKPLMFQQATHKHKVDTSQSRAIGDNQRDAQAAHTAGMTQLIHIGDKLITDPAIQEHIQHFPSLLAFASRLTGSSLT